MAWEDCRRRSAHRRRIPPLCQASGSDRRAGHDRSAPCVSCISGRRESLDLVCATDGGVRTSGWPSAGRGSGSVSTGWTRLESGIRGRLRHQGRGLQEPVHRSMRLPMGNAVPAHDRSRPPFFCGCQPCVGAAPQMETSSLRPPWRTVRSPAWPDRSALSAVDILHRSGLSGRDAAEAWFHYLII
ncbi:hypothetical protein VTK73DRAFT_4517 [Phialemonium thermophilum]|uniref:Uncharacterized protein n=1 Tax=Phialemonium thermophilum TaxID=223376 RepID=A0ABR3WTE2_9PEZI